MNNKCFDCIIAIDWSDEDVVIMRTKNSTKHEVEEYRCKW